MKWPLLPFGYNKRKELRPEDMWSVPEKALYLYGWVGPTFDESTHIVRYKLIHGFMPYPKKKYSWMGEKIQALELTGC